MEIRYYPINEGQLYACNIKLHATEIQALHFDSKKLMEAEIIKQLKNLTEPEAQKLKKLKDENVERTN
jgi:hypothetical protein